MTVFEDSDRFTSLTHQSLLRGSCGLTPGITFQGYEITTSRKEFVGGNNRNLNNPIAFERRHFPEQRQETVFNDKGIYANALFFEAESNSALRLDYIYQRVLDPKEMAEAASGPTNSQMIDSAVMEVAAGTGKHLRSMKMEGSFDNSYTRIDGDDFF